FHDLAGLLGHLPHRARGQRLPRVHFALGPGPVVILGPVDEQHLQAALLHPPHQSPAGVDALTLLGHRFSDPSRYGGGRTSGAPAGPSDAHRRRPDRPAATAGLPPHRFPTTRWQYRRRWTTPVTRPGR